MSRSTIMAADLTPEHKRFFKIFENEGSNQSDLANKLQVTQSYLSRVLSGEYDLTMKLIKPICNRLGYSAEWVVNGKGNPKATVDPTKLVTEIQSLRTEIDIVLAVHRKMQLREQAQDSTINDLTQRLTKYEQEVSELRNLVSKISGGVVRSRTV